MGAGWRFYVPLAGLMDLDDERKRIAKEIGRVDQDLDTLEKKLANPNFASKAPADVVEKDRARIEELKTRRVKLSHNLKQISPEDTHV